MLTDELFSSREQQAGMPPGTLIVPSEASGEKLPVQISLIAYDRTELREEKVANLADTLGRISAAASGVHWLNLDGLNDVAALQTIGEALQLHPLTLEDVLTLDQRPKLDLNEGYLYLVVKMLSLNADGELVSEQVSMVLGARFLITFQERPGDVFELIRNRLRRGQGRIRQAGADYLCYALLDAIVDHYFLVLERYSGRIEELDEQVLVEGGAEILQSIHRLKRELAGIRRAAWPLRDLVASLDRSDSKLLQRSTRPYLRDLYDNVVHIIDAIEILREMSGGLLDLHLSALSNRMNAVMKMLTLITTIFIPATFIAGIYGMNFKHMPELEWRYGYFGALGLMGLIMTVMLVVFRRHKWL